ncbi:hypothetical protein [Geomonas agri]|nr:hypothetical protein [Geomonas agri]
MELKDSLPLPATDQDQNFMANLLEAVKKKRGEATGGRRTYTPSKEGSE